MKGFILSYVNQTCKMGVGVYFLFLLQESMKCIFPLGNGMLLLSSWVFKRNYIQGKDKATNIALTFVILEI